MKKVILKIDGMTCSACSNGLEKYLNKQDGIEEASVNLVMNNVLIIYDDAKLNLYDLDKFVAKAGFKSLGEENYKKDDSKKNIDKILLIVLCVLCILIMYIGMGHMVNMPIFSFLDMSKNPKNFGISLFILTTIVIILSFKIIKNGFKNLIHKTPNMDTLVTVGVFSSYFYSIYSLIRILNGNNEYTSNLYFESSSMVLFFVTLGKYIEKINIDKTKEAIQGLMTITPNNAVIIKDEQEITVTLDEIKPGDTVICKPGEKIAVDGIVLEGISNVDESFITGESISTRKEKNCRVLAGSINVDGVLKYKAEKIGRDSMVSGIVKMMVEASNKKAPISKLSDKISGIFAPAVMLIAFFSFVVWFIISKDFKTALNIFVSVLVVACPCSLGLATPLAIVVSSGKCSKNGILVKSSDVFENANKTKIVIFDKTGTLTENKLSIERMYNYYDDDENKLLQILASVENTSNHPIAKAIVNEAKKKKLSLLKLVGSENKVGMGIRAVIGKDIYIVGNKDILEEFKIKNPHACDEEEFSNDGCTIVYLVKNNKIIALYGLKDTVRVNAKDTVKALKNKAIKVIMLTGDNKVAAENIAKKLDIDNVIAGSKPKDKADVIDKFKNDGITMMCGDGINDSVSLVKADIGVSISDGTDISMNAANVILMNNDLSKINDLIFISQKTIRIIKQNLFWAFFYNILMIPIAVGILSPFGIILNPMIGSLAMICSSLTVIFNSLRLRK